MKKFCILFITILIIGLSAAALSIPNANTQTIVKEEYLRVHIRANSNKEQEQAVKYLVKDGVVEFLAPFIAECDSKEKAINLLNEKLKDIEGVANEILRKNGFSYTSKATLKQEEFPTRIYDDITLDSGVYDALILELGSGKGDNWWCVVYPPLCFTETTVKYEYKSKIYQIISDFFK